MNPYIPLVMLISFSGILLGLGLLVAKAIEREKDRDDLELRRQVRDSHTA